ncbi:hypothetical protein [Paenibacillus glacialis]|uniref:Uncharacterized protein n=1 Tax=Paenibacillus glacialis TaxID=494026 RepID=A0A162MA04_9BACL|nr:hypothetical protein [Paenibacillus glacialis]OAB40793.1 hypothetical protein PGLA_17640 [Paenibacillus glacialis]
MKIKRTILIAFVTIFSVSLLLTGCFESKAMTTPEVPQVIQEKVAPIQEEEEKRFSYLDQLPNERVKAYERFVSDKDVRYLQSFSPEEILLVYFHSVAGADEDVIYALTYDNGVLPDLEVFRKEYRENLARRETEYALEFRYYDSIKPYEGTVKENEIGMAITVGVGSFTATNVYSLKKENNVWKMNIYHLMEPVKSKTKK